MSWWVQRFISLDTDNAFFSSMQTLQRRKQNSGWLAGCEYLFALIHTFVSVSLAMFYLNVFVCMCVYASHPIPFHPLPAMCVSFIFRKFIAQIYRWACKRFDLHIAACNAGDVAEESGKSAYLTFTFFRCLFETVAK